MSNVAVADSPIAGSQASSDRIAVGNISGRESGENVSIIHSET